MLPYLRREAPWFAFLVHPRSVTDLLESGPGRFLRCFDSDESEIRRRLCRMPATVAGTVSIAGSALWGEIIAVTALPEDMMKRATRERVLDAARLAVRRGARTIGLGGLTSPATRGGRLVVSAVGADATVTNGNALTAAVVSEQAVRILRDRAARGARAAPRVAVIGCTGSVGLAACRLLAGGGVRLNLVGRSGEAVRRRFVTIPRGCDVTDMEAGVRDADLVVTLTHDPGARVRPHGLPPASVVLDCAQPRNTSPEDEEAFRRRGIEVIEGATVTIPGFDSTYDFGLATEGGTFSCLAETYLFARLGQREHSVGFPTPEWASRLWTLGRRAGISAASVGSAPLGAVAAGGHGRAPIRPRPGSPCGRAPAGRAPEARRDGLS